MAADPDQRPVGVIVLVADLHSAQVLSGSAGGRVRHCGVGLWQELHVGGQRRKLRRSRLSRRPRRASAGSSSSFFFRFTCSAIACFGRSPWSAAPFKNPECSFLGSPCKHSAGSCSSWESSVHSSAMPSGLTSVISRIGEKARNSCLSFYRRSSRSSVVETACAFRFSSSP